MVLSFVNPGEIDLTAATVLGVNAKEEGGSAIGYFGTGLKYAIAAAMRRGASLVIWQGAKPWKFQARTQVIRGKEFGIVQVVEGGAEPRDLGFTTELGKHWKPWQVFRELMANAMDERGGAEPRAITPKPGNTTIVVEGWPELESAWAGRASIFLDSKALARTADLELHPGQSTAIFYRGVRVKELEKPTSMTYNLLGGVTLTEDRTLESEWVAQWTIMQSLGEMRDERALRAWLQATSLDPDGEHYWDSKLDFGQVPQGSLLAKVAKDIMEAGGRLSPKATALVKTRFAYTSAEWKEPQGEQLAMIEAARPVLENIGVSRLEPVLVAETLGKDVLGLAKDGKIVVSARAFSMGQRIVTGTILEEHLHLAHGYKDNSREMQNWLLDKLVEMAEASE